MRNIVENYLKIKPTTNLFKILKCLIECISFTLLYFLIKTKKGLLPFCQSKVIISQKVMLIFKLKNRKRKIVKKNQSKKIALKC